MNESDNHNENGPFFKKSLQWQLQIINPFSAKWPIWSQCLSPSSKALTVLQVNIEKVSLNLNSERIWNICKVSYSVEKRIWNFCGSSYDVRTYQCWYISSVITFDDQHNWILFFSGKGLSQCQHYIKFTFSYSSPNWNINTLFKNRIKKITYNNQLDKSFLQGFQKKASHVISIVYWSHIQELFLPQFCSVCVSSSSPR